MEYLVNVQQMKALEEHSINTVGIPSLVLMEQAAEAVCNEILKTVSATDNILIVAGIGNNGADALCVARRFFKLGFNTHILVIGDKNKATDEFRIHYNICQNISIKIFDSCKEIDIRHYKFIIDGLLGIGLSRNVEGIYNDAVNLINDSSEYNNSTVFSIDIPSGLNGSSGVIMGNAVRADKTVTFGYKKIGLFINDGLECSGDIIKAEIGIPCGFENNLSIQTHSYEKKDINLLPKRKETGHKGTFGKNLIIAGSINMPGAMLLCARSAYKSGAGMVKVISDIANRDLLMHELCEAMFKPFDYDNPEFIVPDIQWCDSVLIGPGLTVGRYFGDLILFLLMNCPKPVIIDADGLNNMSNCFEDFEKAILFRKENGYVTVITPHPAELFRLFGSCAELKDYNDKINCGKINQNVELLKQLSEKYGLIIVAKDAVTISTDGNYNYINTVRSVAAAVAGSGDVLAGIVSSVINYFDSPIKSVSFAVFIHGYAAVNAHNKHGDYGTIPINLIEETELLCKDAFDY